MDKKVVQFRYFGENNGLNYPSTITKTQLTSGSIFDDYTPIVQLGVQALPGTRIRINANLDWIIVGATGIYELDLTNNTALITSLQFDETSLNVVNDSVDGYLIVDMIYQGAQP